MFILFLIAEHLPEGEFLTLKSSPVGPVAGAFIFLFIGAAFVVYCYRNHLRSNSSHFGSSTPDETNFRMTQLNNEPDETEPFQEPINSGKYFLMCFRSLHVKMTFSSLRFNTGIIEGLIITLCRLFILTYQLL